MLNTNKSHRDKYASREDLVELVLAPLSALTDKARLEILRKLQDIKDSVDIIARQKRRELD